MQMEIRKSDHCYLQTYLTIFIVSDTHEYPSRAGHGYQAGLPMANVATIISKSTFKIIMDYVVIERILFDAILAQIEECAGSIGMLLNRTMPGSLDDWVDNAAAKSMLRLGTRSMQTMRSSGKIGYSIIDGKVFYPMSEIERVLTQSYRSYG